MGDTYKVILQLNPNNMIYQTDYYRFNLYQTFGLELYMDSGNQGVTKGISNALA